MHYFTEKLYKMLHNISADIIVDLMNGKKNAGVAAAFNIIKCNILIKLLH